MVLGLGAAATPGWVTLGHDTGGATARLATQTGRRVNRYPG